MKITDAKRLFKERTEAFFQGYNVIYAQQSRSPKPAVPLVTLAFGNVQRPLAPIDVSDETGELVGFYLSRVSVVIDLFTNGRPVTHDGSVIAYENTAMEEMLSFADYLNAPRTVDWCHRNDISILIDRDPQDLTGIVNDNFFEYRARLEITLSYTQDTLSTIGTGDIGYFSQAEVEPAEAP